MLVDALAVNGARPSAGTVMPHKLRYFAVPVAIKIMKAFPLTLFKMVDVASCISSSSTVKLIKRKLLLDVGYIE